MVRYHEISYDAVHKNLSGASLPIKRHALRNSTAAMFSKRSEDLTAVKSGALISCSTRVEDAFRDIKTPLMERPLFSSLQNRTTRPTFFFACWATICWPPIEHRFLQAGVHTSWEPFAITPNPSSHHHRPAEDIMARTDIASHYP